MAITASRRVRANEDVAEMMVLMSHQMGRIQAQADVSTRMRRLPLRLMALSKRYLESVQRNYSGMNLSFEEDYTELKSRHIYFRFTHCSDVLAFIKFCQPVIKCINMHSTKLLRRDIYEIADVLVEKNLVSADCALNCPSTQQNDNAVGTLLEKLAEHVGHIVVGDQFAPFLVQNCKFASCKILGRNQEEVQYMPGYLKIGAEKLDLREVSALTDLQYFDVVGFPFDVSEHIKHLIVSLKLDVTQERIVKAAELFRQHIPSLEVLTISVKHQIKLNDLAHLQVLDDDLKAFLNLARSLPTHFGVEVNVEMHLNIGMGKDGTRYAYRVPEVLSSFGNFLAKEQLAHPTTYSMTNNSPGVQNCKYVSINVSVKDESTQPVMEATSNESDDDMD